METGNELMTSDLDKNAARPMGAAEFLFILGVRHQEALWLRENVFADLDASEDNGYFDELMSPRDIAQDLYDTSGADYPAFFNNDEDAAIDKIADLVGAYIDMLDDE